MAEQNFRVGVIGLGIMGSRMIDNMLPHPDFSFSAAWDPSQDACLKAQTSAPGLTIADRASDLISAADTDLVYIACPPVWHKEYADAAMAAGKPIYCEKPLGIDVDQSRALVSRLDETKTPNVVNFAQAACEAVNRAENRIKAGEVGDISGIDINVHFSLWPRAWQLDADWLRLREQGGYTREVLSHFLYLLERLAGKAELISSTPIYPSDPALCETHITATLDCSGVPAVIHGSSGGVGPDRVEMTIWGSKQSLRLHDWFCLATSDGGDWQAELADIDKLRPDSFRLQLDQVSAWMAGEEHVLPDAAAALSVQELVEEML